MSPFARTVLATIVAILPIFATETHASAQGQSKEAIAEQLFLEGQRLLEAGKIHEACERLTLSQHVDPAIGALLNLALCHELEGKTATAWSEYQDAAVQAANAGQKDREAFAREHAAALSKELTKVRIALAPIPEGTQITLDGTLLPAGLLNTEIPIDPGEHALAIAAPHKKPWHVALRIARGAPLAHVEVALEEAAPATIAVPAPLAEPAPPASTRRIAGYITGGVGIAAVGVGALLLVRASLLADKSDDEARKALQFTPPDPTFKAASLADHGSATTNQTAGLVTGALGAAALGAGLYLVLTSRDALPAQSGFLLRFVPRVGADRAGLELIGAF